MYINTSFLIIFFNRYQLIISGFYKQKQKRIIFILYFILLAMDWKIKLLTDNRMNENSEHLDFAYKLALLLHT